LNATLLQTLWQKFNRYKQWLSESKVALHTQRAYISRINQYLVFLATENNAYEEVLTSARTRDRAVEDYKDHLKHHLKYSPATINTTLSTIDHFYQFLGLGDANVGREELARAKPVALTSDDERCLLDEVQLSGSKRDLSIVLLFLRAGLRLGECAALNLQDVESKNDRLTINIRSFSKNRARQLCLEPETAAAVKAWLARRTVRFPSCTDSALFLSRLGKRITTAGIDLIIRKLGRAVGLEISAEILRNTCLTKMLLSGKDVRAVKKLSGHKRLETTKRYGQPVILVCEETQNSSPVEVDHILSITPFDRSGARLILTE
jgi:site-specific recombinase XerC